MIEKIIKILALIIFILAAAAGLVTVFFTYYLYPKETPKSNINTAAEEIPDTEIYEDPSAKALRQEAPIKKLDLQIMENRDNELVFQASIDDFIDSYNGYY